MNKLWKNAARLVTTAAVTLVVVSQVPTASTAHGKRSKLDDCSVNCGAGGGCSAGTPWYVFWEDCDCHCGNVSGTAICSCS